ncbi:hypothetical protein FA95DRAFT_1556145 [Auriscalpium vulgare]|uniref:Uncharacterized protein n=1 Tax=Auriscalpium vulgare TaxID=40419 RepID=A0ACB8S0X0_9AGAM|nr:hypothetical protein FA95DRAFT_1556145 [Auriscalpium vulgare]
MLDAARLDSYEKIDKQILVCADHDEIRFLKAHRNALTPIARLPDALITTIFLFFRPEPIDSLKPSSSTWLSITHVCRAWRLASLECALLWTDIVFDPPSLASAMLDRAKSAPLTVNATVRPDRSERLDRITHLTNAVCQALTHIRHIRVLTLQIVSSAQVIDKILATLSMDPAKMLEKLTLYMHVQGSSIWLMPDHIFSGSAPHLRALSLSYCQNSWSSVVSYKNLTHLKVTRPRSELRPSLPDFLDILRQLPDLQALTLEDTLPELPPTAKTLPPMQSELIPISFLNMTSLFLDGHALDIADIMRYITVPNATRVRLYFRHRGRPIELPYSSTALASTISALYANHGRVPEALCPARLDAGQTLIRENDDLVESTFRISAMSETGISLSADLIWEEDDSFNDLSLPISQIFLAWPLHALRMVTVFAYFYVDPAAWLPILEKMASVRDLCISGLPVYGFSQALRLIHERPSDHNNVPMPAFKYLDIQGAHFSYPLGAAQLIRALERALGMRSVVYSRPIYLTLTNCHITDPQLAMLQVVVAGDVRYSGEPQTLGIGEDEEDSSDMDWDSDEQLLIEPEQPTD